MAAHPYITVEDVRHYLLDRTPDDNDLLVDLAYDDNDIRQAMVYAARDYNSIPPLVASASPECLPAYNNMFLDCIVKHLYIMSIAQLTRNDIDYTAGGVGTNIVQKRIAHLRDLIAFHQQQFVEAAKNQKLLMNIDEAFGAF